MPALSCHNWTQSSKRTDQHPEWCPESPAELHPSLILSACLYCSMEPERPIGLIVEYRFIRVNECVPETLFHRKWNDQHTLKSWWSERYCSRQQVCATARNSALTPYLWSISYYAAMDIRTPLNLAGLCLLMAFASPAQQAFPIPPLDGNRHWRVQTLPDLKKGGEIAVATVQSTETIATRSGQEAPTLMISCSDGKLGLFVRSNVLAKTIQADGKIVVPFQLRSDSGAARAVLAMESRGHDAFLLPNAESETGRITKSKTLRVAFERFQGGKAEFSFDVSGFEEARAALRNGCRTAP
jgi:hypothetical protein